MQNKKYENIQGLREKILEFEMDNLQNICNKVFKELNEQNKDVFRELKNAKESFEKLKKVDKYPYYSAEYDLIKELEAPLKKQFIEKLTNELDDKKLNFNIENFYSFLSNSLKIEVSDIGKLFHDASDDLIKIMNEYDSDNNNSIIHRVINYYKEEYELTPFINKTIYDDIPNFDYIENKYNANINCFNFTGKYIQDFDKTLFKNSHPEVYYYYEYAKTVGLLDEKDVNLIQSEERIDASEDLKSLYEEPFTPEEYCYAMFYKNSSDFYNKMLCANCVKNGFERAYLDNDILIPFEDYFIPLLNKININTTDPKKFRKIIEDIVDFCILHIDKLEFPDDEFEKVEKKFIEKTRTILSSDNEDTKEHECSNYVDKDRENLSNNKPNYPGSGEGGRGSM